VLIVDGNPHMTVLLQRFLTRQQVDTQTALSTREARTLLIQHVFRVVITDDFPPSGDGMELLRYIRQTVPDTRGIVMTAFRTPALWCQALAAGAYACLAKPFRLQELWDIVQPALEGLPAPEAHRGAHHNGLA
jgi:DNA-binding NtrC family response regulator